MNVDEIYNEFWKSIVEKDGKLNIEQVKKELADYYFVMKQVPKVYSHITGGKLSKIMYEAETVIAHADDYEQELRNEE